MHFSSAFLLQLRLTPAQLMGSEACPSLSLCDGKPMVTSSPYVKFKGVGVCLLRGLEAKCNQPTARTNLSATRSRRSMTASPGRSGGQHPELQALASFPASAAACLESYRVNVPRLRRRDSAQCSDSSTELCRPSRHSPLHINAKRHVSPKATYLPLSASACQRTNPLLLNVSREAPDPPPPPPIPHVPRWRSRARRLGGRQHGSLP